MNTNTNAKIDAETLRIDMEVGIRIREYRKVKGLSQTDLGQALGVSFQQIQKYERGTNRVSSSSLVLISRALECDPSELLGSAGQVIGEHADPLRDFLNTTHGAELLHAFPALPPERQRLAAQLVRTMGEAA